MKIVITGANSAVGQAIFRRALKNGMPPGAFVAAVRSGRAAEQMRPLAGAANAVVQISYDDPATLDKAFDGASAIIHLAGILVERPGSTYERANVDSTRGVVEAAKRVSVQKFVLVSATNANADSMNRYYRTKGQAEALVRDSGLRYTILRAPLLLGPETGGTASVERNLRKGKAMLIDGGRNLQQPLYVDDLAQAAIAAAQPPVASDRTLDVVGPVSLPEREIVERASRMRGRPVRIGSIPKGLLSFVLGIRQRFAGPGFSPDAVEVITANTRLDSQPAVRELGIQLTGIDEMIKNSFAQG